MTEKLYDINPYIQNFSANVLSCTKDNDRFAVVLDKTAFFPNEGGQKCDTGTIGTARVFDVALNGDTIVHYTDASVQGCVECALDFEPRLDKMRQHSGEHILSGVIHRLFGYDNVGFHLSSDDVTCDFNGPLTPSQLDLAETQANAAVVQNLKISSYYPDAQQLKTLDYRSKSEITGNVRIVEIEGVDFCACCAPHVAFTGEVGLIKITEFQNYKGGMRLHIACGERALRDYRIKTENLARIAKILSSGKNNAADFFDKYVNDTAQLKIQLSNLKRELILYKAASVCRTDGDIIIFEDGLDMNALRAYVNAVANKCGGICMVLSGQNATYSFVALSKTVDMNNIKHLLSNKLGARCGGNDKMIQGTIPANKEQIEIIIKSRA